MSDIIMESGETLHSGASVKLVDDYIFIMQEDCNLVLYDGARKPVWASDTGGLGKHGKCTLNNDGTLGVYLPSGKCIWETKKKGASGQYVFILDKDKDLGIYGSHCPIE